MTSSTGKDPLNQAQKNSLNTFTETIVKMLEAYFKLFKLEAKASLTNIFSIVIICSVALILLSLLLLFASIGTAHLISYSLGWPEFAGFFLISLFYLLIILLIYWKRRWIWTQLYVFLDKFDSEL
ncbi:phage holin family protein [Sediminitomix flava]|uniref:Putative superfamily III holin-X n=1 Tax=Sediminitomix flava TaxID=379075 RepID=A0A315ZI12_SEDFL|nr:phage holin family protein [Sediminitomix flava]PWJ44942.1 putative superfamily III holin-X [Sediminitomix flava]